jgi:hypothetical protein
MSSEHQSETSHRIKSSNGFELSLAIRWTDFRKLFDAFFGIISGPERAKNLKKLLLIIKKKPFHQYKSFMIKNSFDVVRITSSSHLRLCPKGSKFENIALNLEGGGGGVTKEIISTFELD